MRKIKYIICYHSGDYGSDVIVEKSSDPENVVVEGSDCILFRIYHCWKDTESKL